MNILNVIAIVAGLFAALVFYSAFTGENWQTASRESAGIAALPQDEPEALVQIYTARAFSWRKYFAVHSWIATKEKGADHYIVYQVIGWNLYRKQSVVSIERDLPDRYWYSARPSLIYQIKGVRAEAAIPHLKVAAKSYPYPWKYHAYPGPNSNSFIAHLIRHTPEIGVELPSDALGKDWIDDGKLFGPSESGTGIQFSVYGLLGLTMGKAEGVEVNVLGMSFGLDILRPALKLPFVGRIGMADKAVDD